VLMNLCINARDAMPGGGRLSMSAHVENVGDALAKRQAAAATGPHVVLEVADTGAGIPPEILDKIFDPFFTTKPLGKGTGLGLSTVLGIVRSHRGFIRVDSSAGHGARFRVYLPVCAEEKPEDAPPPSGAPPPGQGEGILLVDDEDSSRQVARRTLEKNAYRVIEARNGAEAVAAYERDPARIQLVVTDLMMPGMDGVALLRRLRQTTPALKAIAMTGGLSPAEMEQAMETESAEFLLKPFGGAVLLETVRRVLRA